MIPVTEIYTGTRRQRSTLRSFTAGLIGRYVEAIELCDPAANAKCCVTVKPQAKAEIAAWKELTWHYVIDNPALATQQEGQRRVIRELFTTFDKAAANESKRNILPPGARDLMEQLESGAKTKDDRRAVQIRITADVVADMTEQEAVSTFQAITGSGFGSIMNGVIRSVGQ
jgi:dGTPase